MNPQGYCQTEAAELTDSEDFKINSYFPVIDQIVSSLDDRIAAYEENYPIFVFLRDLHKLTSQQIKERAAKALDIYKKDLEEELIPELIQFKELIKESGILQKNKEMMKNTEVYA